MVRSALRALVRPAPTLEDPPSFGVATAVGLLVAVAAFASAHLAGGILASHVTGTDTVDNPNYPGDRFCDDDPVSDEIGTLSGCGQPERVQRSLSVVALGAVRTAHAGGAFLGTLLLWPLLAGLVHGFSEGHGGSIDETARQVAPAFLPALGRHAARPVAVALAAPSWPYPQSVEPLRRAAAEFASGGGTWLRFVVVVTVAWQAYVLAGALRARGGDSVVAYTIAGVAGLLLGLVAIVPASAEGVAGIGLLVAGVGLAFVLVPEALLRHDVKWDLFGYRTEGEVEPKPWLVASRRLFGVVLALAGVWAVGGFGYV